MGIKEVTKDSWQQDVLNSDIPVLVDFWATWCVPCKMIGKVLDSIESKYSGKFKFVKLNSDQEKSIAMEYGIRSLPTLIIFKNGNMVEKKIGALSKGKLIKLIESHL